MNCLSNELISSFTLQRSRFNHVDFAHDLLIASWHRIFEPEIHRSVWQGEITGLCSRGNVPADDIKIHATQPDLARPGQQSSEGYPRGIRRHIEHDVTHCPRPRPAYRPLLHIVETYHCLPFVDSHPQPSPTVYISSTDSPPETNSLARILGRSDRLHQRSKSACILDTRRQIRTRGSVVNHLFVYT